MKIDPHFSSLMKREPVTDGYDALVISDLHLGSSICLDKEIHNFLERIVQGELKTNQLILNGDVFDSIDFRRLRKGHWKILSLIRKLSDRIKITWVCGNHEGVAEPVSQILGVEVQNEYAFQSGNRSVLVIHGHIFDDFIETYPRITFIADVLYRLLQIIDSSHRIARYAKSNTKIFLRCVDKIRYGAKEHAKKLKHDIVCCGHTHQPESSVAGLLNDGTVEYHNSGSWTENPCTFLSIRNGAVHLHSFTSHELSIPKDLPAIGAAEALLA